MTKDIRDEKRPCQAIGCKRLATCVVRDTAGRKSYRCETHAKPGVHAGVTRAR